MRLIPQIAVDFVEKAEDTRTTPYRDSGGIPTVGTGHIGPDVHMGQDWTLDECEQALRRDLNIAAGRLDAVLTPAAINNLDEHEYAALISFVFNLGARPNWTIWKLINAGKLDQVPDQIKRFDKGVVDGKLVTIPGLDHRRLAEITLWRTADVPAAIAVIAAAPVSAPPSSQTRYSYTPPTPPPAPTPLLKSKSFMTSGLTAVVASASAAMPVIQGASGGLKQMSDAISPYADGVPALLTIQHGLTMALAGLAMSVVVLLWITHKQVRDS